MKLNKAVNGFAAIAQESRLQIFRLLMEQWPEGVSAGSIAEALNIPATTLSFHLSQLSGAKLIESRKEGRSVIYTVNLKRAKKLAKVLTKKDLERKTPETGKDSEETLTI